MSTSSVSSTTTAGAGRGSLAVYHHSTLFYWWPVWLLGFVLAGITYFENHHLAIVPSGTKALAKVSVELDGKKETRDVLVLEDNKVLLTRRNTEGEQVIDQPHIRMTRHKGLGTLFIAVLLLVVVITNVTMRGLLSVLIIMMLAMISVILYVGDWWPAIIAHVRVLSIHINFEGYLVISIVLFTAWVINFFFFDRQTYMVFSPGQVRAKLTIGGGETVYGTAGMVVQKQRGDLFRHWILGFGSGDLIVRPSGGQHPIEMPNVLRVGSKVRQIEQMVKEQVVVSSDK